ncbi:Uncharacterised protein [Mycobacteroides abscessus]|nr:Uncharacterised protein [Mycobacteroides abscessus]
MPKNGVPRSRTPRSSSTSWVAALGSPGPFEKNTPSGAYASMSAIVEAAGTTCTRTPRWARRWGVIDLMPRSTATTVATGSPSGVVPSKGSTTYAVSVLTSRARSAPAIAGAAFTSATRSSTVRG